MIRALNFERKDDDLLLKISSGFRRDRQEHRPKYYCDHCNLKM